MATKEGFIKFVSTRDAAFMWLQSEMLWNTIWCSGCHCFMAIVVSLGEVYIDLQRAWDSCGKGCVYEPRARQKTAWLAVDWVNWLAHGKSKWAGLTYIG